MGYENILVQQRGAVAVIQFNRPSALNALNQQLMSEALDALESFDANPEIGCLIVTGNERAFAAGADIKQMVDATPVDRLNNPFIDYWDRLQQITKPIVAAVSGYALGGGCEFAMACDMIVASESAQFGQPEINIGVMPGAGGTQRLTRAVGKAIAMEMVLADRRLSAREAVRYGLANKVVPVESYLDEAVKFAQTIAERAPIARRLAKQAVNAAFETSLQEGLKRERLLFNLLFSTEDQKEGMQAFIEKRQPQWQGR